ncbi:hypothetical protein C8R46DRAFT_1299959 [Mycena filopes]|nr:hypothetical protein C8R46DRAFT_1299959 [Mycena filopes]
MTQNGSDQPHIVIIGAGIGGMIMAIELKRMGCSNFTIIEKAAEVGGTWRDNIYPGCSSDVAIHLYSLSTDMKPDWVHSRAFQPAIQEYWIQLAFKHDLYPNIVFNRKVISAHWDIRTQKYQIITEAGDGSLIPLEAAILVSAIGLLEVPRFPDIPGISSFRGDSFHSARWNYAVPLAGKRVAVIGSGASATQFVPIISEDPTVQVTQFFRSPTWVFPSVEPLPRAVIEYINNQGQIRKEFSSVEKWLFRYVPLYARIFRNCIFLWNELLYLGVFGNTTVSLYAQEFVKGYMKKSTPAEYADRLIPSDPDHSCKRIVYDTNYLASLARPNMSLVSVPIESIGEEGVFTQNGLQAADVIIYSTGYITDDYPINIKGTEQTVSEYYRAHGGPTAYLGTAIPGFPNFFTLFGANTATGHTSVVFAEEVQVQYILQLIRPLLAGEISSVEVTAEATDAYNRKIQSRLLGFAWSKCRSWYRAGNNGKPPNILASDLMIIVGEWWVN